MGDDVEGLTRESQPESRSLPASGPLARKVTTGWRGGRAAATAAGGGGAGLVWQRERE